MRTTKPEHDFPLEWQTHDCRAMKQLAFAMVDYQINNRKPLTLDFSYFIAKRDFERSGRLRNLNCRMQKRF